MIEKLLDPGFAGDGVLANDILCEFERGFPIENLRPLLVSSNENTLAAVAFLLTFMGFRANCFVVEITALLDAQDSRTRSDAIESLANCTTPADDAALGRVLLRLDDEHPGVRWKVIQFIRLAQPWQLKLGLENAAKLRPDSAFATLVKVHGQHFAATEKKLRWLLAHTDPIVRRFGAAIATKPRYVVDEGFVEMALQSDDAEVSGIATDCCQSHLTPIYAVWSSLLSHIRLQSTH
ncbi:hypothetical protein [Allomesorhizobium camelthorni]|uniref:HEAT repeat domain-containing protein n=1 Tax=Allomesorhizobium camelthorni TaxID=475069 RepID=A0A6G4WB51_9HYPH|nr:hypothetical protein [Mesorhizobium camelthorni]NGO51814.1 hypothetical protein [Mesorhizobium camelthorni]